MDNNLLIEALKGLSVDRPPVWMMRQAGRYLPDFMKLKEKYDFFTRCRTPELVTEITLMPINQIGVDAAIIFSDILVVLQAINNASKFLSSKKIQISFAMFFISLKLLFP